MKTLQSIDNEHNEAMEHAHIADRLRCKGSHEAAKDEFGIAYGMERGCAEAVEKVCIGESNDEPQLSRDILYRSAMFLANNASLKQETIEMANKLLSVTKYLQFIDEANELLAELKEK